MADWVLHDNLHVAADKHTKHPSRCVALPPLLCLLLLGLVVQTLDDHSAAEWCVTPFACAGVDGMTTFSPGTWVKNASGLWLW
jgi:hypothetical protein